MFAFCGRCFWLDTVSLFVSKVFLQQQTITSFLCNQFFHFQSAFGFKFIAVYGLSVAALIFAAAPYMGFCARLAGRCPARAAANLFGFCSGLDKHRWAFGCYLLLFYLYSAAVAGLDVKTSSPATKPCPLAAIQLHHSIYCKVLDCLCFTN